MEPSVMIALITLLSAPIATIAAWVVSKRKTRTDIAGSIALASGEAVDAIREVMDSLREELKETKKELEEFKMQNKELETSLKSLHYQNQLLLQQNELLAKEISAHKSLVDNLSSNE